MKNITWISLLSTVVFASLGTAIALPTPQDANLFIKNAEKRLETLQTESQRSSWIQSTFITDDTEMIAASANERLIQEQIKSIRQSRAYEGLKLPKELSRKIHLLKTSLILATPSDPEKSTQLTRLLSGMEGKYGKGSYCPERLKGKCLDIEGVSRVLASSKDPSELVDVWQGWHQVGRSIKPDFIKYVDLANQGAREMGFKDTGAMWRMKYDMEPEAFAKELDRLWLQVRPLYLSLHAYVRNQLRATYGDLVPEKGPIPIQFLGNLWGQSWSHIYPILAPKDSDPGFDLTKILKNKDFDSKKMVKTGEAFFTSLGFSPLPQSFWEKSQFEKPNDRNVVCHASAWDIDSKDDLRIKMCIQVQEEDFYVIHHELGHNFYQRAYNEQPVSFRDSANDGFHEAVGDTIALSITPDYLKKIGLLSRIPDESKDIGILLRRALDKIAFLPFGLMIDQWRWQVFSGKVPPEKYNSLWWDLHLKYQGVVPPTARTDSEFDPGAKYHVPAGVPYMRYFLAHILQFQFHRALAKAADCNGPLHRCSIYGSQAAGQKLNRMLAMGMSRPWQDALYELSGERQMDATAILDYFAPLKKWLDEQNAGKHVGWETE